MDFSDSGSFDKALELNESQIGSNYLTVEEAKPRGDFNDSGRSRGDRGSSRGGRRDFGGRSGRSGGRFGNNRGRGGRSTFNKPSLTASGTVL